MVELTGRAASSAVVGDVQELPFADGIFDCAVAAWMLYHVPDLDRALRELARVLRPGGRLVAVTNSRAQPARALEPGRRSAAGASGFSAENGEAVAAAALRARRAARRRAER